MSGLAREQKVEEASDLLWSPTVIGLGRDHHEPFGQNAESTAILQRDWRRPSRTGRDKVTDVAARLASAVQIQQQREF